MFLGGDLAAKHDGHHLVAKVPVVDRRVRLHQKRRPAGRDQGVVVLPVAALPEFRIAAVAAEHATLHDGELVMGGDDAAFPVEIPGREGLLDGVTFQQKPHRGHLAEVVGRHGRDLEAALAFCDDKPFRAEAAQELPHGADAGAVALAHAVEPKPLARGQPAEHDVGSQVPVGQLADRLTGGRPAVRPSLVMLHARECPTADRDPTSASQNDRSPESIEIIG